MSRVKDLYPKITDFDRLLEDAALNASTEWEMEFVDNMTGKYDTFGGEMFLTEAQHDKLRQVAG